jgi:PEP-CTERM putative exosortase interaction domain
MKKRFLIPAVLALSAGLASAQSLMLDFGQQDITAGDLTTSPGHATGRIPLTDTTWNKITSSVAVTSLNFGNGTAATGVTLTMGQEGGSLDSTIYFSVPITSTSLAGTGGSVPGWTSLLGESSIYGQGNSPNIVRSTAGRDGFFGGGTASSGQAVGLRIDGLAVGDYVVYVMARNTNTNSLANPMNIYTGVGASAGTFDFSALTAVQQANTTYPTADYDGQFNSFIEGNNYVAISFTISTAGQAFYLVSEGATTSENRGFLNSVQIVAVPEPAELSVLIAGGLGVLALLRRRKVA